MSLTIYGNRTGRAASIERHELTETIRTNSFNFRWYAALANLKELDPDWEKWYDARPEQTAGEMYPVICARILELKEMEARLKEDQDDFLMKEFNRNF
jgi:hypothetical protein